MRNLKPVKVGNCTLDGSHIYIQSMLNTRSDDIAGSVAQAVHWNRQDVRSSVLQSRTTRQSH